MSKLIKWATSWIDTLNRKRREQRFRQYNKMSTEEIFSQIYANNIWGGEAGTFYSGEGTADPNASKYISLLVSLLKSKSIHSIVEIGCGDFKIMQKVLEQMPQVQYTGVDVVNGLIEYNQQHFANEHIRFQQLNAITEPLPHADLVIIRQVLQHLNNAEVQAIIDKIKPFKYALITEHVSISDQMIPNLDKVTGPHIRTRYHSGVFIDQPPFSVPNTEVLLEYRFDEAVKNTMVPAVIRTYLVENEE